jgi:hypothetical protein
MVATRINPRYAMKLLRRHESTTSDHDTRVEVRRFTVFEAGDSRTSSARVTGFFLAEGSPGGDA